LGTPQVIVLSLGLMCVSRSSFVDVEMIQRQQVYRVV
jgi:hypothetical protein